MTKTYADTGSTEAALSGSRLPAALQAVAALLWLPQAAAIAYAIDHLAREGTLEPVIVPALVLLALGFAKAALNALGRRLAFRNARRALSEMRVRATSVLAARSPVDINRPDSGSAASVLGEQAEALVPYLARYHPTRLRVVVIPLAILACVLPFSWISAVILLVAAPLIPLFMALIGWRARAASREQLDEMGSMNAFLLDRLRGLATIRALDAVDQTADRFQADAKTLRRKTMAVLRIAFLSSAVLELFAALGVAMVAVYVGFHLLGHLNFGAWGTQLSLGEGLFILLLAPAFFEPLRDLSATWHDRAAGQAAEEALADLATQGRTFPASRQEGGGGEVDTSDMPPGIAIEGLDFSHAAGVRVFENLDLRVSPGEHLALFGPSGSGKSTLLALMAGLVAPDHGRILIGGVPLEDGTADDLRRRMAWVGQRPHIFQGTMARNVSLDRPGVGEAEIDRAFRHVSLEDVVRSHAGSLGEAGVGLSGGEVLRLALARAVASPEFGIVLADEPTAHLDAATAADIGDGLMALAKGRTMIVATHDPRLAHRMDRIVDLTSLLVAREAAE
ncbi:thiol reductant ABC exporter subunit CydD [Fodinicurvata fenggangensis]|uniref:thiol reductant ABC exporter subunit CydD n=1 Tax=Fodinicurvata fenggangensis TaxID=1121830 RepID=UPI00047B5451|nr:thiol reductant ABC exporter subunit CydD [Fodinicurvata fenggangensis]